MVSVVRDGTWAPLVLLAAVLGVWAAAGAAWALAVALLGGGAILAFNLRQLDILARWADGPLDAPVPAGRAHWRGAFDALHRRVGTRSARQRDLATTIERFVDAAEAIPDGMVVLDTGDRVRWTNARAELYFGLDRARDVGAPIGNFVRQPEFIRYLNERDYAEPLVLASQRQPGTTLSLQIIPFGVDERLLISRDITRLEAVDRMRRDFIANVSHELKTPLTVISGFLETMQDVELDPAQQRRSIALMSDQARSMERLVNDLLALSALESEDNPRDDVPFPFAALLDALHRDAQALSQGRHEIVLEAGDWATITGSRDELASAFGNLVSNAVRYTPEGGTITLRWARSDGAAGSEGVFSVADTGVGVAAEHVPRLTERFYRVDRSRSRETGGTGLGLAIVKHVLARHQARLAVRSVLGQGSTFSVHLPARRVRWSTVEPEPQRTTN